MTALQTISRLIKTEMLLGFRNRVEFINALIFYLIVVIVVPLSVSSDVSLLSTIAPGVIWVAALLSSMIAMHHLFFHDYASGCVEQWILSAHPLTLIVLSKVIVFWLFTGLPLLLITPLSALLFNLSINETLWLIVSLALGTPVLSLVGAIAAALTLGLRGGSMLLIMIVIPLVIPVLIFGVGLVQSANLLQPISGQLALLGAFLMFAICLAPLTISACLRISLGNS